MPTFQPSALPAGAYRVSNKNHDYWIVDADGNIIGQTGANGQDTFFASYQTDSSGNVVGLLGPNGVARANTITLMGDSLSANNWSSGEAFINPFPFAMANAIARNRFKVVRNIAAAGTSTPSHLSTQMPVFEADPTKYVYYMGGTNDIFIDGLAGDVVAARVIAILERILAAGSIPIWSTLWARPTQSAAKDGNMLKCNAILRTYATNNNVGIFYDGFYITQDPGTATLNPRTGWRYDGPGFVHSGSLEGYWLGKYIAKAIDAAGVPQNSGFSYGPEDNTTTTAYGKANLLVNPCFAGTGGTKTNLGGATVVGNVPDNWTVAWTVAGGTGVATCSVVDVTDPDTGLACAKGLQIVITGSPNNADVIRVSQAAGFTTSIAAGETFSSQVRADLSNITAASTFRIYHRSQTNEDSRWWGIPLIITGAGANGVIPENTSLWIETRGCVQVATSSAAVHETWIAFSATGVTTGTITLSQPRFRSSASAEY